MIFGFKLCVGAGKKRPLHMITKTKKLPNAIIYDLEILLVIDGVSVPAKMKRK